ncbi:unnamed protein product [Prorocentrum cordatum]|uniref:Uncharacterized protein n=1 Tax=Prorocentrum cordatum TaxID=2364126 RepID=A0ABN9QSQ6_9DINO|nr:unnamed protein product [Polarella glacialis]
MFQSLTPLLRPVLMLALANLCAHAALLLYRPGQRGERGQLELAEEYSDDHMAQGFVLTMPFVLPCVDCSLLLLLLLVPLRFLLLCLALLPHILPPRIPPAFLINIIVVIVLVLVWFILAPPLEDEGFDFEPSPVPSSFQIVADSAFPELSQSADDSGWQVTEARGVLIVMKDRLEDAKALYVVQEEEEDESLFESADGTKWQDLKLITQVFENVTNGFCPDSHGGDPDWFTADGGAETFVHNGHSEAEVMNEMLSGTGKDIDLGVVLVRFDGRRAGRGFQFFLEHRSMDATEGLIFGIMHTARYNYIGGLDAYWINYVKPHFHYMDHVWVNPAYFEKRSS